jgi:hypothetical protein
MYRVLQVFSIVLVAMGMGLSLAHALELPGKMRLPKETYMAVQFIYYPGFTIGGMFGEFGAMLATFVLLILTPTAGAVFWLTLAGFLALLVMHALYWTLTHPVNNVWVHGQRLNRAGAAFFAVGAEKQSNPSSNRDWTRLRDRWEHSHVARALCAMLSLIVLVTAATI